MNPRRAEPFLVALHTLRERLREGTFGFEQRLAAKEIAAQLELSATPVREALARLAGEGLVEDRRGQGYFVRRPSGRDVADLFRLSFAHLAVALERGAAADGPGTGLEPPGTPRAAVVAAERLFDRWVGEGGGWALAESYGRVQSRLAPVRRREPQLIPDLVEEAAALMDAAGSDWRARLAAARAFHRRRIRLAERLAGLLESRPGSPPV